MSFLLTVLKLFVWNAVFIPDFVLLNTSLYYKKEEAAWKGSAFYWLTTVMLKQFH